MKYVLRLDEITMADLALVGSKAARLGDMVRAGFPVPSGFCVTTRAFEPCCTAPAGSGRFEVGEIPPDIAREVIDSYTSLGHPAVAVRSSATLEDTREFSFAGQYESFLQIVGTDSLLRAVRECWASLWSFRTVGYRERAAPGGAPPRMGIIVQAMVPARAGRQLGGGIIAGNSLILFLAWRADSLAADLLVSSVLTSVIMAAVGVLACAAPARRALRIQPTEALRQI